MLHLYLKLQKDLMRTLGELGFQSMKILCLKNSINSEFWEKVENVSTELQTTMSSIIVESLKKMWQVVLEE